jgi:polyphosphate kinase
MTGMQPLPTRPALLADGQSPFIHRDLSWLQFNERVLAEAREKNNPLLERAKFLAISASNIDEFFMIRFASLNRTISLMFRQKQQAKGDRLQMIRATLVREAKALRNRQTRILEELARDLSAKGIQIVLNAASGSQAFKLGETIFREQILPQLGQPEKFAYKKLTQLGSLQMAALLRGEVWCPLPKSLPVTFLGREPGAAKFYIYFLDDLLSRHLGSALGVPGAPSLLRVTRDGDITLDLEEEDTESIPDAIRSGLGTREKGRVVRLQHSESTSQVMLQQAASALRLGSSQVYSAPRTLCLHGLWSVINQLPEELAGDPELSYRPVPPLIPPSLRDNRDVFEALKERDFLLHHPYDSFDAFVQFIARSCSDPLVTQIELTVYRTDAVSPLLDKLKEAAKRKIVRVIIELRARFDELNNLKLAEDLRRSGVEVSFGFGKLKVHAKMALITRVEDGQPRLYTHLSTGNYKAVTARQYTDMAILTANPDVGADARLFFDTVVKGEIPTTFKTLVSAPAKLHRRIHTYIENEIKAAKAGQKARIFAKVNALVDESIIQSLYSASQAGVQVDLIVRGACSLIPGVKGLSENIRVISIVDRFLEHSRIYLFQNSRVIYLSSADWMPRNFFSRLELAYPVLDPRIYRYIEEIVIPTYLSDTVKAQELTPKGTWKARHATGSAPPIRSQTYFQELAARGYKDTPLQR